MMNSAKPRILIFIDWYSPGYKAGGPVRSMVNLTNHLSDEFTFFIVTRNSEYCEKEPYPSVKSDTWTTLSEGVNVWYSSAKTPSLFLWKQLIGEVNPAVVYINGVFSPKFSILPLIAARQLRSKKIVVAPRGMLAECAVDIKGWKKRVFLFVAKWGGLYKDVFWHATNQQEAEQIIQRLSVQDSAIYIAANLPRAMRKDIINSVKEVNQLKLCSFSRVDPNKNTLYALESLRSVDEKFAISFDIYGQIYDSNYWALCEKEMLNLPKNVQVNYKGVVDAELILQNIEKYHALFFPTRGENFGHVILESFMAGRPVVISDQTPWQGLQQTKAGWDLPLLEPLAFSDAVELLASMNQQEFDEWCNGAWELGRSVAEDKSVLEEYRKMFVTL